MYPNQERVCVRFVDVAGDPAATAVLRAASAIVSTRQLVSASGLFTRSAVHYVKSRDSLNRRNGILNFNYVDPEEICTDKINLVYHEHLKKML